MAHSFDLPDELEGIWNTESSAATSPTMWVDSSHHHQHHSRFITGAAEHRHAGYDAVPVLTRSAARQTANGAAAYSGSGRQTTPLPAPSTVIEATALPQLMNTAANSLKDIGEHAVAFITAIFISTFASKELAYWQNNALFFVLILFSWIGWQFLAQAVRAVVDGENQLASTMASMDILAVVGHLLRYILLWHIVRLVLDSLPLLLPSEAVLVAVIFLTLLVNLVWLMRLDAQEIQYTYAVLAAYYAAVQRHSLGVGTGNGNDGAKRPHAALVQRVLFNPAIV